MVQLLFKDHLGAQARCNLDELDVSRLRSIKEVELLAEQKLGLQPGTFDLYDDYGRLEGHQDIQRACRVAGGSADCVIHVREHSHIARIKALEARMETCNARQEKTENTLDEARSNNEEVFDGKVASLKAEFMESVSRLELQIQRQDLKPVVEELVKDRDRATRELNAIHEKLATIDIKELREFAESTTTLSQELTQAMTRVDRVDQGYSISKASTEEEVAKLTQELRDLQRYVEGKLNVCIESNADLRRHVEVCSERGKLLADDLRLLQEDLRSLATRYTGALEESEELRTLLGEIRESHEYGLSQITQLRLQCLEAVAVEKWSGFAPGVLYFRRFHAAAKGNDVQLNADKTVATGRGFLAASGVIVSSDEGLCVADGPCRRFGTPGFFSSYYEIELDEICAAPKGVGGLYVGFSLQSGDEVAVHSKREFDGWLLGGPGKALICRASATETGEDDLLSKKLPATYAPGIELDPETAAKAMEAMKLLQAAMPPVPKGKVREVESNWSSEALRVGDRIGVLYGCLRDGGGRLKVTVNGELVGSHDFVEAPPAEAVGFLTPVIRLAGAAKSVRILPGLQPPSRVLAD